MDKTYPPDAWKHLGKVLERRRGQLGYGFRQRGEFLRAKGGPPPSAKMLARLERGERTAYPDSTLTLLESMYGYAPGSFEAILRGEEPVPLPGTPGSQQEGGTTRAPLRAVPVPATVHQISADDSDEEIEHKIAGDEMLGFLWRMLKGDGSGLEPRSVRIGRMNRWLADSPEGEAGERRNGTSSA